MKSSLRPVMNTLAQRRLGRRTSWRPDRTPTAMSAGSSSRAPSTVDVSMTSDANMAWLLAIAADVCLTGHERTFGDQGRGDSATRLPSAELRAPRRLMPSQRSLIVMDWASRCFRGDSPGTATVWDHAVRRCVGWVVVPVVDEHAGKGLGHWDWFRAKGNPCLVWLMMTAVVVSTAMRTRGWA